MAKTEEKEDTKLYVNKPGGAIISEVTGESVTYPYGAEINLDQVQEGTIQHLGRVASATRPPDAPEPQDDGSLQAAMIEAGQVFGTASSVPGNYDSLSEDEAIRLIQSTSDADNQSQLLAHEISNQNRTRVKNAASNDDVLDKAEVWAKIKDYEAGTKKAKAEVTTDTPSASKPQAAPVDVQPGPTPAPAE